MNVIYIAYSCSPDNGSESAIGWNIPKESAKTNRVFVITVAEQKKHIARYLDEHPIENFTVYYVKDCDRFRKVIRKLPFTVRLNLWHRRTLKVVRDICSKEKIDIIHQITPIEFRSIGNYGKIPNVKFVCGPIAGGQAIPKPLLPYVGKHAATERLREMANKAFCLAYKISGKLKNCDYVLFANKETKTLLKYCVPEAAAGAVLPEIAVESAEITKGQQACEPNTKCRFLVAGRLVYLKGHEFLLDALAEIPESMDYECRIVGTGPQLEALKKRCRNTVLEQRVTFAGRIPFYKMPEVYEQADVLVFPTFREATGSVILEAMARGKPVITINRFGGAVILDGSTGWLYDSDTREGYVEQLKNALISCIINPEEVARKGCAAREQAKAFTWEKKTDIYRNIYNRLMENHRDGT